MAYNKEIAPNFKDIAGKRFGKLVAIERVGRNKDRKAMWRCVCDCGKEVICAGKNLRSGNTRSCGCGRIRTKHGLSHTRLFLVWRTIKSRCYNPHHKNYVLYHGRDIGMCEEWRNDFKAFHDWAMANGYDENAPQGKCTIDRIDNSKGYSPDNCRWVDMKVQNNNTSRNRKVSENERNKDNQLGAE